MRPYFSRDNINNLAATQSAADALIRIVVGGSSNKGTVVKGANTERDGNDDANRWTQPTDLLPLFFNFTMDTSTEFLFGEEVGALAAVERQKFGLRGETKDGDTGYGAVAASNEFAEALRVANDVLVSRLRLQNLYWLGDGLAFRKATRTVWQFVDGYVGKALAKVDSEGKADEGKKGDVESDGSGKKSKDKKFGLLESLLEQTRDRDELIAQTLGESDFFLAFYFQSSSLQDRKDIELPSQLTNPPTNSGNDGRPRHDRRPPRLGAPTPNPPPLHLHRPPRNNPARLPERLPPNLLPPKSLQTPPALPPRSPPPAPHGPHQQPRLREKHNPSPRRRCRWEIPHGRPCGGAGRFLGLCYAPQGGSLGG